MTPKEKAKELVESFKRRLNISELEDIKAIQCALICVDAILYEVYTISDKKYDLYTEVKKEINKL